MSEHKEITVKGLDNWIESYDTANGENTRIMLEYQFMEQVIKAIRNGESEVTID